MRVLYVTNGFPYPLTSGYLRHYFLIRELAREHRITLLSLVGPRFDEADARALAPMTERILTFPTAVRSASRGKRLGARLAVLASEGDPAARSLAAAIAELRRTTDYDAAVFSGKRTYPALAALRELPLVIDLCDAASVRIRGQLRYAPLARRPILALDYWMTRAVERRLVARADHLLVASWRDLRALLGPTTSRPATVVPNGVDLTFWQRRRPSLGRDTIVFTGAMDYPPNTDAAFRLIETILPRVRRESPAASLLIVGRDPTPRLLAAGRQPGVTVTGFVEDVRPYLEAGSVFAAPLRFGAGIQNKLLEAMAMAVPSVASPLAVAGLRTTPDDRPPVEIASDDEAFTGAITRLLQRARQDPSPDSAARAYVTERFDWARSGSAVSAILTTLAEPSTGATARPIPSGTTVDPSEGRPTW